MRAVKALASLHIIAIHVVPFFWFDKILCMLPYCTLFPALFRASKAIKIQRAYNALETRMQRAF